MFFIKNHNNNPRYNLALEEYVLKNLDVSESFLLLWQNEPSIIIGRFQNTYEEINQEYVDEKGLNVIRRLTGGGAVYHDLGNVNFSFIEKAQKSGIDFERFIQRVIKALASFGIEAEANSRNDIAIEGRKISGNAQYVFKDKVLHHGTLLFNANLQELGKALKANKEKIQSKGVQSVSSRVANISEYLSQEITVDEFKTRLYNYLTIEDEVKLYQLTDEDKTKIDQLIEEKYNTWQWNYGKSPEFNFKKEQRFTFGLLQVNLNVANGRVTHCRIFGDFFSSENIAELEQKFINKAYTRNEISHLVKTIDIEPYFKGMESEEFVEMFF